MSSETVGGLGTLMSSETVGSLGTLWAVGRGPWDSMGVATVRRSMAE